jgi:hypothetical protein
MTLFLTKLISYIPHPIKSIYKMFFNEKNITVTTPLQLEQFHRMLNQSPIQKESTPLIATSEEREIIQFIKKKTAEYNLNNITRTVAYLSFYKQCPEVHWAFLAHMVSRNGGWNMTDLKGNLISNLIKKNQIDPLFLFLERSNAFIFQDAYPQLLLYKESRQREQNLFHLLPYFSVSSFMKPFWDDFFSTKNSQLLTIALIVNEQQHLQKHVIENPFFQEKVFETLSFLFQQWLGFMDVLLPFQEKKKMKLAGATVHDFANVDHRIDIGKTLYGMLFHNKRVYDGAYQFAINTPHTGSRADFWPELFTTSYKKQPNPSIYSPMLVNVWPNMKHHYPQHDDWFNDVSVVKHLKTIPIVKNFDLTEHYTTKINELSSLLWSKQHLF